MSLLLEHGSDVNIKENNGQIPLLVAASNGMIFQIEFDFQQDRFESRSFYHVGFDKIVDLLIQKRSDVNTKNNRGWAPLHYASSNGHVKVAELLIQGGARINEKTTGNWTALQDAAYYGDISQSNQLNRINH